MGLKKKKFEFSKIIIFVFGLIEIGVIFFTCHMVYLTCDTTPLAYLIPSTAFVGAAAVKHYFEKAKVENRIKLMNEYKVELTPSSFKDNEY